MIYMDPHQLGWEPLVKSWMEQSLSDRLTQEQRDTIRVSNHKYTLCVDLVIKRFSSHSLPSADLRIHIMFQLPQNDCALRTYNLPAEHLKLP